MKIKLKTLSLITYDETKKKHYHFVKDMCSDQLMQMFIPEPIEHQLIDSSNDTKVEIGSSYIVGDNKALVGYVRLNELDDCGVLTLHYGVGPDFRRKEYGTRILVEVSDYAFKNIDNVNGIKLHIRNINQGSIKCAKKALFKQEISSINDNPLVFIKKSR